MTWKIPPDLHREIGSGPLCFFSDHSIGSRDGIIPRYADSHACVRCVSSLVEGRLTLDVHRIHREHRRKFLEFWAFVEIGEPDECWHYRGTVRRGNGRNSGYPLFPMRRHYQRKTIGYSPCTVAIWFSWGDIGRLPSTRLCSTLNCCNPLHYRIRGVPHFYHRQKFSLIEFEYGIRKINHETGLYLQATKELKPQRFKAWETKCKEWLDYRLSYLDDDGNDAEETAIDLGGDSTETDDLD